MIMKVIHRSWYNNLDKASFGEDTIYWAAEGKAAAEVYGEFIYEMEVQLPPRKESFSYAPEEGDGYLYSWDDASEEWGWMWGKDLATDYVCFRGAFVASVKQIA